MNIASNRLSFVALAPLIALASCSTAEKGPESSSMSAVRMSASPELEKAVEEYRGALYQASFDRARAISRSSNPPLREQAAWVAGLSAYQMKNLDEAELQFMAAARSQDARLVTDTKIMIGDIRVLQNRWSDAARCYRDAAAALSGEERSRLLGHAASCDSHASGRLAASGSQGSASPSSPSTASAASDASTGTAKPPEPTTFALQAGAFQNEKNARRLASNIASSTRNAGLGEPRVVRTKDRGGREFWTVQVGTFASRQTAESARSKVPSLDLIVAAAG